jgi:hypothetical protein
MDREVARASSGVYLTGLLSCEQADFAKVRDFRLASDEREFVATLTDEKDPLYHYVRVIEESSLLDFNNLLTVLDSLTRANPKVSIRKPPEPHPRGGFSLFLNSPNSEADVVLDYLRNHGWLPCI